MYINRELCCSNYCPQSKCKKGGKIFSWTRHGHGLYYVPRRYSAATDFYLATLVYRAPIFIDIWLYCHTLYGIPAYSIIWGNAVYYRLVYIGPTFWINCSEYNRYIYLYIYIIYTGSCSVFIDYIDKHGRWIGNFVFLLHFIIILYYMYCLIFTYDSVRTRHSHTQFSSAKYFSVCTTPRHVFYLPAYRAWKLSKWKSLKFESIRFSLYLGYTV